MRKGCCQQPRLHVLIQEVAPNDQLQVHICITCLWCDLCKSLE